jgi:succinate dehydrogenase / fumarate reductase flavoprotein subunit
MVFGEIAGIKAAEFAKHSSVDRPLRSMILAVESFFQQRLSGSGQHSQSFLRAELQQCMWQNLLVVRSEKKLLGCLEAIHSIRDRLAQGLHSEQNVFGRFELENMLAVSEVMTKAALARRESRGSHYREDFPVNGDGRWRKPIIMKAE